MPLTGYLKIDDIPGESQRQGHEDEIDIFDISWAIEREQSKTVDRVQSPFAVPGRVRATSVVGPIVLRKNYDAASPYLADAVDRGRAFRTMVISVSRPVEAAHVDYLQIILSSVRVSSYSMQTTGEGATGGDFVETIALSFEEATFKYTQTDAQNTVIDEHEVKIEA